MDVVVEGGGCVSDLFLLAVKNDFCSFEALI
jgi:hypothetical protein